MTILSPFKLLPTEAITHIFIFLPPKDIRNCQNVCWLFRNEIVNSALLQYLLELDALGYCAPLNPRRDLSYDDKIKLLRRNTELLTRSNHSPTILELDLPGLTIFNSQCARGVFAHGGPNLDVTRSIHIQRLSSCNKGSGSESWKIPDLQVDAHSYRIDPDQDLLVLLHINPAPDHPEADLVRTFHFRSLKTGEPHPLAAVPTITSLDVFTSTFWQESFQIFGNYVALLSHTNHLLTSRSPRIWVWDWTTGQIITMADVVGKCFAFVSESCFIVESVRRSYSRETIGSLEVYKFDPHAPGRRAHHAASLHLPTTPGDPCHSSIAFIFSPPTSALFQSRELNKSSVPPRVYDLSPTSYYICARIRVHNIEAYPNQLTRGSLLIPASIILNTTVGASSHDPPTHISWENWAKCTYWVNEHMAFCQPKDYIFGRRFAPLMRSPHNSHFQIPVYELGPSKRAKLKDTSTEDLAAMPGAHQYLEKVFTASGHARHPDLVALITVPTDVMTVAEERPDIMVDDEHVTIYQAAAPPGTSQRLYVYTI